MRQTHQPFATRRLRAILAIVLFTMLSMFASGPHGHTFAHAGHDPASLHISASSDTPNCPLCDWQHQPAVSVSLPVNAVGLPAAPILSCPSVDLPLPASTVSLPSGRAPPLGFA